MQRREFIKTTAIVVGRFSIVVHHWLCIIGRWTSWPLIAVGHMTDLR